MRRWMPLLLALTLCIAPAARANWSDEIVRDDWQVAWSVDWDGTRSRARVHVFTPPWLRSGGRPEWTWRLAFPWIRPMCVTWERWPGRDYAPSLIPAIIIRKPADSATPVLHNADRTRRRLERVVIRGLDGDGQNRTLILTGARVGCFTTYTESLIWDAQEDEDFIVLLFEEAEFVYDR